MFGLNDTIRNVGWFIIELYTATPDDATSYLTAPIDDASSAGIIVQDHSYGIHTVDSITDVEASVDARSVIQSEVQDIISINIKKG